MFLLNSQLTISRNTFNFGKVPFFVTERTDAACFEPALNTIQMKDVTAITKGNAQSIIIGRRRIGLVLNRRFIERIAANGAL